jgi:HEPN domain-containing protein
MDEALRTQAMEWFERGDHDIGSAQLLYDQHGYTDSIAYHIQQAMEKYLKGYLVLKGRKPPRMHDLDVLLDAVADFEPDVYERYIDLCERATRYYIDDRYPPGPVPDYTRSEIGEDLRLAWELIETLRQKAGIDDDSTGTR